MQDLSFTVQAGEILSLIGLNGAGKSTVFDMVTGALAPNRGQVASPFEAPHRPDPIMRWPRADREEKRVTHGTGARQKATSKRSSLTPATPIREDIEAPDREFTGQSGGKVT